MILSLSAKIADAQDPSQTETYPQFDSLLTRATPPAETETQNSYLRETATVLEEVIVTAQCREEDLQDVPISITAFNEARMEKLGAQFVRDLQYATPNLLMSQSSYSVSAITIRGIRSFTRQPGVEGRAGVYIDGVWVGRSQAYNQNLLDLEQVEVLRGPQGTLFGRKADGG